MNKDAADGERLTDRLGEEVKYDEFIKEVQERGHMASGEEAEEATRATLRPWPSAW